MADEVQALEYEAFVFLRRNTVPVPGGYAGHAGWGFQAEDGGYYGGGTENTSGEPVVVPPSDNGAWISRFDSSEELFAAMRGLDYGEYKISRHRLDCDSDAAVAQGEANRDRGYDFAGNNCLHHTAFVLEAYGVGIALPSLSDHPYPSDWFDRLDADIWTADSV
ncbi:MAG: hypothetical protein ABL934_17885 [Lysobacteraceae bacterium]